VDKVEPVTNRLHTHTFLVYAQGRVKYSKTVHIKIHNQETRQENKQPNTHSINTGLGIDHLPKTVPDNLLDGVFR